MKKQTTVLRTLSYCRISIKYYIIQALSQIDKTKDPQLEQSIKGITQIITDDALAKNLVNIANTICSE
jgi:hypothetical protein